MRNYFCYVALFSSICHSKEQYDCKREPPNTCCYNQYLNEDNKTCTECPYGSFGLNCNLSCLSGYYGRLCRSPCECVASECHHVTGCVTTYDPQSVTTSATDLTSHRKQLDFLGFSVLGSLSSLCIFGCVLFIRSRNKKLKFRSSTSFLRIRQVLLPCVNQDRQREVNDESRDIELSNVNTAPVCGQKEDDSPYSEIRYSQFIGSATTWGAFINTVPCTIHKCNSDKHHNTSEHQNIYQTSMDKNEYDHVNLKVKPSDKVSDRNLSLPHSNDEEYVSLLNKPSLGTCNEVRTKNDLKCQNLTLPKNTMTDFNEMGKSESKAHCLLTEYSLQKLKFEMGVGVDQLAEKTKHQSVDPGWQTCPHSDNRPYSMARDLSDNDLSETVVESSNLQDIIMSENKHLSQNNLS